jgi:hypothetical protein
MLYLSKRCKIGCAIRRALVQLDCKTLKVLNGQTRLSDIALKSASKSTSRMKWWVEEDLNLRPHAYQACALTT